MQREGIKINANIFGVDKKVKSWDKSYKDYPASEVVTYFLSKEELEQIYNHNIKRKPVKGSSCSLNRTIYNKYKNMKCGCKEYWNVPVKRSYF